MNLITGANGFLGSAVLAILEARSIPARGAVRTLGKSTNVAVGEIGPDTNWLPALRGVDVVIHTAARVHVMNDLTCDPLSEYRKVNVEGSINLALQAAKAGVKRFIYLSSIKVNGESTCSGTRFSPEGKSVPNDPYGLSKYEAEQGLLALAKETNMEVVIIRPPLVYGPGVKANFATMMKWIDKGVPLPLGVIQNKRSLVALDNLVDLIMTCIDHPAAANQVFLAADGEDLSTTELLQKIGKAMGKPARLIPVPVGLLKLAASILGKKEVAQRLCGSLQVDISKARELLGWEPPISVDEGLRRAVEGFKKK